MTSQPESPHEKQALERIPAPLENEVIEDGRTETLEILQILEA